MGNNSDGIEFTIYLQRNCGLIGVSIPYGRISFNKVFFIEFGIFEAVFELMVVKRMDLRIHNYMSVMVMNWSDQKRENTLVFGPITFHRPLNHTNYGIKKETI